MSSRIWRAHGRCTANPKLTALADVFSVGAGTIRTTVREPRNPAPPDLTVGTPLNRDDRGFTSTVVDT